MQLTVFPGSVYKGSVVMSVHTLLTPTNFTLDGSREEDMGHCPVINTSFG